MTFTGLSLMVVAMLVLNTGMGAVTIPPATVVSLLAERVGLEVGSGAIGVQESVLWSIRLPRIVLGLLAAGALAAAGVGL
ncbi:MAG: iron chelate uptake ABC transporter family permease subunit, partial [bacterium]|nr:iron chelate uptake ABC transporter family permease subunit [bacterium]